MASPTEPPIWRKKVRLLVATPSFENGTAFWTMIVNTDRVGPIPRPAMNIHRNRNGYSVSARSCVMSVMPTAIDARPAMTIALYLPVLDTRAPATIEEPIRPMSIGKMRYPDAVAVSCRTTWNQRGRKMIAPKNPKLTKKVARIEDTYVRFRQRSSGTIGSLARDSARTNNTLRARPIPMKPPTENVLQSPNCLLVKPTSRKPIAIVKIRAPR